MSTEFFVGNIVAFFHIPKTAGTTLKERYKNSENFYVVDDELKKNREWYPRVTRNSVFFGHDVEIGMIEKMYPKAKVSYICAMRDPRDRIMSSYNFIKTQAKYINPSFTGELDFLLWFANKDIIRPMPHLHQYQYFYKKHSLMKQFYKSQAIMNDQLAMESLYMNTEILIAEKGVNEEGFHETKSYIDNEKKMKLIEQTDAIEKRNSHFAFGLAKKHFEDIWFTDQNRLQNKNFVERFDEILEKNKIKVVPDKNIERTNDTKLTMKQQGLQFMFFHDLSDEYKQIVNYSNRWEQAFYDKVKEHFGNNS